jgi:hypothetical protein
VTPARGDQAEVDRRCAAAAVAAAEQPILPADGDPAERPLGLVVVDVERAVFAIAAQRLPVA